MDTREYIIYTGLYLWLALLGACTGSFINVVVYRLPKGIFFASARSFCPVCRKQLAWGDLLPLFSWLALKGCCRYCHQPIPRRYPLVEAAGALLVCLCYGRFGLGAETVLAGAITMVLLTLALIDQDTMEIPHSLLLVLLPLVLLSLWVWPQLILAQRLLGMVIVSLPMLLLALAIPGAFGGGDIKLMALCGFLLGWQCTLLSFFVALLTGGSYAAYLLASGRARRGAHIAFGPYLCLGVFVAMLWGGDLLELYLKLIL